MMNIVVLLKLALVCRAMMFRLKTVWLSWIGVGLGFLQPGFDSGMRGFSVLKTFRRARFMTMLGVSGVELPDRRPHP